MTQGLLVEAARSASSSGRDLPKSTIDRMISRQSSTGPTPETIKEVRGTAASISKKVDAARDAIVALLDEVEKNDKTSTVIAPTQIHKLQVMVGDLAYMTHVADAVSKDWPRTRAK